MSTFPFARSFTLISAFVWSGCGHPAQRGEALVAEPAEAVVPPTEVSIPGPRDGVTATPHIALPDGWAVNPDFGTLVFEPGNRDDFYEPPSIELVTAVEGQATPDAIPENITRYIRRVKESSKRIQIGNSDLDAQGAKAEILEETAGTGQWGLTLKLTYPEGVSEAMYSPRIWVYRFLHQADEPFFLLLKGKIPIREADQFLAPVSAACRSARRRE